MQQTTSNGRGSLTENPGPHGPQVRRRNLSARKVRRTHLGVTNHAGTPASALGSNIVRHGCGARAFGLACGGFNFVNRGAMFWGHLGA